MEKVKINIKNASECPYREYMDDDYDHGYMCTFYDSPVEKCEEAGLLIPLNCPLIDKKMEISLSPTTVIRIQIRDAKEKVNNAKRELDSRKKQLVKLEKQVMDCKNVISEKEEILENCEKFYSSLVSCQTDVSGKDEK